MQLKSLALETSTRCNARCIMCYAGRESLRSRPAQISLFKALGLIDEAVELGCTELHPFFTADPFCYKDWPILFASAARDLKLVVSTNGQLLDAEALGLLVETVPVMDLIFSIDYTTIEEQERIRPGLSKDVVFKNVYRVLAEAPRHPQWHTTVRGVALKGLNDGIAERLHETFVGLADEVVVVPDDGRGNTTPVTTPSVEPCRSLFTGLSVLSDGTATMCCQDYRPEFSLGNVFEQGLEAVWNGPTLAWTRQLHQAGQKNRIAVCNKCNVRY